MLAPGRDGQRATEEVRDIGHRRTPGDGLPVNDRQRPVGTGLTEQHVVQPIVAVDEAVDTVGCGLLGQIRVEAGDQPLANLAMLGGDPVAIALNESGVKLCHQRLVHR